MNASTRRTQAKRPKPIDITEDEEEGDIEGKPLYKTIYTGRNVYLFTYFSLQNAMMNWSQTAHDGTNGITSVGRGRITFFITSQVFFIKRTKQDAPNMATFNILCLWN